MPRDFLKDSFLLLLLWLCWVFIAACGLPLVAMSGGYSQAVVHGLLTAVASLVAERRHKGTQASQVQHVGSVVQLVSSRAKA